MKKNMTIKFGKFKLEELLKRKVVVFGSSSHIILPKKHTGKRAIIMIEE